LKKISVITNVLPSYRNDFVTRLIGSELIDVTFYVQKELKGVKHDLIEVDENRDNIKYVKSLTLGKNKLVFQFLPFVRLLFSTDVYVFTGNPRVLSTLLFSFILYFLKKDVVMWGHVHTAGASPFTENIRLKWWSIFGKALVYTEREKTHLEATGFTGEIVSINNGLNYQKIEAIRNKQEKHDRYHNGNYVSCARLLKKNRFDILIEHIPKVLEVNPHFTWEIIGDGDEFDNLTKLVDSMSLSQVVKFHGAIYDENIIASIFTKAKFLIHPGAIGLSALHALSYSLPIITHNVENEHMPEFSVLKNSFNSILYNKPENIYEGIKTAFALDEDEYDKLVINATYIPLHVHNTEIMAKRFIEIVKR